MPVDFLTAEQEKRYGRYTAEPDSDQFARYFHLDDADRTLVAENRGDHNRLGFALQFCTARFLGTFLDDPTDVPPAPSSMSPRRSVSSILSAWCATKNGLQPSRTCRRNPARLWLSGFSPTGDALPFLRWLYSRAWISAERPSVLFDLATAWLAERKILLPGVTDWRDW